MLEDPQINDGTQVVSVGEEDNFDSTLEQLVKRSRVVERLKDITVARGVPVANRRVGALGSREERVPENTGISGLIEGDDIDVVSLVLFDNRLSVVVGVEGVHEDQGHADVVSAVQVFDLAHGQIEKGHAFADFNDGLGANAAHGGSKATIELDDRKLVQEVDGRRVAQVVILDNLAWRRRSDTVPGEGGALGSIVEVSSEEREEVVHFSFEALLLGGVLDGVGERIEGVPHLGGCDVGRGILEGLSKE